MKGLERFETSVIACQSTLRNNPEDLTLEQLFIYAIYLQNIKRFAFEMIESVFCDV